MSSSGPGKKSISRSISISTSRSLSKSDLDLELEAIIAMPPTHHETFFSQFPRKPFKIRNLLYCTVLYNTVPSLADTHLLIKLFMLGPLDKSFMGGGGGGGWHCNYSFKLQGSRGDLERLSLFELDSRP